MAGRCFKLDLLERNLDVGDAVRSKERIRLVIPIYTSKVKNQTVSSSNLDCLNSANNAPAIVVVP